METADQNMKLDEIKKQVRWGTVSVLEFRVGYNASAVPESGGPPVGLIGRPTRHSYSMIPSEDDVESTDSDRNDLWLDPMDRARTLAEDHAFPMEDIALICRDVRATLDSRLLSRLDKVTEKRLESSQSSRCNGLCSSTRQKVLLY
ncbi:uncharacterized protein PITG_08386 [Phytophthora infestans T30-4]|uniref:Uncharacterized protein n=1 Tax=Phytophthora infestans (strain T30-4) TaxID=403677 RepID=D0NAG9_PHYIT|nr:uncharacterized protein PITG_08386 [Phytophthora infestans T30-4]EEY54827.1 hypothetical protein PITG_08386 [Phytophthora infestans T30-4]|eukprot:XP_002903772.1 hypothetical protein PITG_08386 [Phytophthora infestans T30-4]